jgi:hypothetical protein
MLVWVQYEAAALRLEQLNAHAGNVEEGVVGRIGTACAMVLGKFPSRKARENAVMIIH